MWAQVNELLFKKYFGTRPVTPLHNLYWSNQFSPVQKTGEKTGGWVSACSIIFTNPASIYSILFINPASIYILFMVLVGYFTWIKFNFIFIFYFDFHLVSNVIVPSFTIYRSLRDNEVPNKVSDKLRVYQNLGQLSSLVHQTVSHSLNFVDSNTGAHTQKIERFWKTAKDRNKRHNGTHRSMLDSYMCKFMWRNRVKACQQNAFETIIIMADIVVFWPPA